MLPTILTAAVLAIIVGAIVRGMVRARKNGESHCGGCSGCASADACNAKRE